jgi:membrane-bound metal-dependent hydrolase YbcI (DUF457 family)
MFVGHGLLAFALTAAAAHARGWPRERALAVGAMAAAFALAPDVDMAYAPVGFVGADGLLSAASGFWSASTRVHRSVTHSLVVGLWVTLVVFAARHDHRLGAALACALALAGTLLTGPLAGAVLALFAASALLLAFVAARLDLSARTTAAAAALGVLSHPFGDVFTGEPPAFLYPFDVTLLHSRVVLHPDPTFHLLAAMGLELLTAWLAVAVYLHLDGRRLRDHVSGRATLGAGYAGAVAVLPAPTLETSYPFVFSVIGLGLLVSLAAVRDGPRRERPHHGVVTGLTAVTLAALAYAVAYAVAG